MFLKEDFLHLILKFTINLQHDSLTHYNEYIKMVSTVDTVCTRIKMVMYIYFINWLLK